MYDQYPLMQKAMAEFNRAAADNGHADDPALKALRARTFAIIDDVIDRPSADRETLLTCAALGVGLSQEYHFKSIFHYDLDRFRRDYSRAVQKVIDSFSVPPVFSSHLPTDVSQIHIASKIALMESMIADLPKGAFDAGLTTFRADTKKDFKTRCAILLPKLNAPALEALHLQTHEALLAAIDHRQSHLLVYPRRFKNNPQP